MATLDPTLNFWGVLFESKQIIKAHSRHFLALTVLFLFPLSFSLIIYPTFQTTFSQSQPKHIRILLSHATQTSDYYLQTLALPLIFTLFVSIFSLCAIGTITYSTYHGFYGRPVKLASAIKSLFYSFIPLAITTIVSQIVVFIICASFAVLVPQLVEILGFDVDYNSNYFLGFCVVVSVILLLLLVRLQVNWALACVIVVVESKWGFEPLRRSTYLMKGMRPVSLYLTLFFGALIGVSVWACSGSFLGSFSDVWKCLSFVLQTVLGSSIVAMFLLQNLASNTVLYMYCKALRGELAGAIAEDFAREYVSLPFDDAKVPHVVFVAQA